MRWMPRQDADGAGVAVQQYACPKCGFRADSFQAAELLDPASGEFLCQTDWCREPMEPVTESGVTLSKEDRQVRVHTSKHHFGAPTCRRCF
jgi:hypothetical protein